MEGEATIPRKWRQSSMVVYEITNRLTGAVYIGSTSLALAIRWNRHVCAARQAPSENCNSFYQAIKTYGWRSFDVKVVDGPFSDLATMKKAEVSWIRSVSGNCYNSQKAVHTNRYSHLGEALRKIAEAARSESQSLQWIADVAESALNKAGIIMDVEKDRQLELMPQEERTTV